MDVDEILLRRSTGTGDIKRITPDAIPLGENQSRAMETGPAGVVCR